MVPHVFDTPALQAPPRPALPTGIALFRQVWDHFIPACAVVVRRDGDAIRYLHPRKGWKRVALKRFGQWRPVAENLLAETETK